MTVFIGIGININDSSGGRVDGVNIYVRGMTHGVLNLDPSGVNKEASKCSERGSTYGVIGTKGKFEEIVGTKSGTKEIRVVLMLGMKRKGDCTNHESKEVGGCNDVKSDKEMGLRLIYLHLPLDVY